MRQLPQRREIKKIALSRPTDHDLPFSTWSLSKLAEEPSDLVLTDIEMPVMDGFELTEAIRAHASVANIPVLILTSRSSEADRQRGLDVGADGYIIKSGFDEGGLLAAVNRLLGVRA